MDASEAIRQALGLGLDPKDLTVVQVALRGIVVFIVSLAIVRIANRRFLAKLTAFDAILALILASMLARAVNGSAPFFPTLVGGFVLVGLHALMAALAYRWGWFGFLVKGRADVLVRDGKPDQAQMKKNKISEHDLMEEARLNGQVMELPDIRQATIERSGEVSIVPRK